MVWPGHKQEKMNLFPILDLSYITNKYTTSDEWRGIDFQSDEKVKILVDELSTGFGTWGFLYVNGHGIPQDTIDQAFAASKEFFIQSNNDKLKFRRGAGISLGYLPPNGEIFDEARPDDIKEAFDFLPKSKLSEKVSKDMPSFVSKVGDLFEHCSDLLLKLLRLLAIAMDIDSEHFVKLHEHIGDHDSNGTTMRALYYPTINSLVSSSQRRCTEHTDYGTITLLFQDDIGGLEVQSPSGEFIKAVPIPGTIVINAADLLHTWSNGKFLATTHRVTIPMAREKLNTARQSFAFFTHPDYNVNIEYTDEDGNVKTRNAYDHLKKRFDNTIIVK